MEKLREEFEAWYVSHCKERGNFSTTAARVATKRGENGDYADYAYLSGAWYGFVGAKNKYLLNGGE